MADRNMPKDWSGEKFGRWTVVSRVDCYGRWNAKCDCGTEKVVSISNLRSSASRSCGCWKSERTSARNFKHGHSVGHYGPDHVLYTSELSAWICMVQRCTNPKYQHFDAYGGRGISVCCRWRNSSMAFLADMGSRPGKGYSLDRKDTNGNYSCGNHELCEDCRVNNWLANCRWATKEEQMRNVRSNWLLTFNGETMCMTAWAERYGLPAKRLFHRLSVGKWSIDRALTEPVRTTARRANTT